MFFSSLFPCFPQVNLFSIFLTLTHFAGSDTSALGRMEANDLGHLDVMEELVNRGLFIDCLDVSDMGC